MALKPCCILWCFYTPKPFGAESLTPSPAGAGFQVAQHHSVTLWTLHGDFSLIFPWESPCLCSVSCLSHNNWALNEHGLMSPPCVLENPEDTGPFLCVFWKSEYCQFWPHDCGTLTWILSRAWHLTLRLAGTKNSTWYFQKHLRSRVMARNLLSDQNAGVV